MAGKEAPVQPIQAEPTGSALQQRITRRRLLQKVGEGVVGFGTLALLGACDTGTPTKCGDIACPEYPPLEVPDAFRSEVNELVNPIRRLIKSPLDTFTINFSPSTSLTDGKVGGLAYPGTTEVGKVYVFLPDETSENLEAGKTVAVHEASHMFDLANGKMASRYLDKQIQGRTGRRSISVEELAILQESGYDSRIGDALNTVQELFASTSAIMKFYPGQFMDKINEFPADSRRMLATVGLVCLDAFKKYSAIPVTDKDLPFAPKLVTFLQKDGVAAE